MRPASFHFRLRSLGGIKASSLDPEAVMLWLAWVVLAARRQDPVVGTWVGSPCEALPLCSPALVLQSAELVHGFTILLLHFDSQA